MEMDRFIPPQSNEAEMSVLGGIFLENKAIDTVHEFLISDDFYRQNHREIFNAMADLHSKNNPIDLVTTCEVLKKAGKLEEVGGGAYVATLVAYVPTAANIAYYCQIVQGKAEERKLLSGAQEAIGMIQLGREAIEVREHLEKIALEAPRKSSEPVGVQQALRESMKGIKTRHENKGQIHGISYGIHSLDLKTMGLSNGHLIVIAGRPSMGKTAMAGNVIESACVGGKTVLVFSLEMPRDDIIDRFISSHGSIKYHNIRSGQLEGTEWDKLVTVAAKIHEWPLFIDDTPGISLREIKAKAKRQKRNGLDLVVVDYIQLMSLPSKENRTQAIGEVSRGLKQLARELEIPVIALSQLSRGVETRPDKRPLMSDLRDSGEIEQDADVILFPFRPTVYCAKCKDGVKDAEHDCEMHRLKAEIIIEKQRHGERNLSIPVAWIGEFQRFAGFQGE